MMDRTDPQVIVEDPRTATTGHRRLAWLVVPGLAAPLALAALVAGFCELNLALAITRLEQWRAAPAPLLLDHADAQLRRAALLPIRSGELWFRRGQSALFRGLTERAPVHYEQAAAAFARSIQERPRWPDGYVWYAVALARTGAPPDEINAALEQGLALGPASGRLLGVLRDHAGAIVPVIGPRQREQVLALATSTGRHEPRWVARAVQRLGWLQHWCDRPAVLPLAERECRQLGWTP